MTFGTGEDCRVGVLRSRGRFAGDGVFFDLCGGHVVSELVQWGADFAFF